MIATGADGTSVTAFDAPLLQLAGAAGITATTADAMVITAGASTSITAGGDVNIASQGNLLQYAQAGISLFTIGRAADTTRPNQENGIALHAASGKVCAEAHAGPASLTVEKNLTVASTNGTVMIAAPSHLLMTTQGAYLKLEGGNISLHGPGTMAFKASMKEFAGPQSISSPEQAQKVHELKIKRDLEIQYVDAEGNMLAGEPIGLSFHNGVMKQMTSDGSGKVRLADAPLGPFRAT